MLKLVAETAPDARALLDLLTARSYRPLTVVVVAAVHEWARAVLLGKYARDCDWAERPGWLEVRSAAHRLAAASVAAAEALHPTGVDVLVVIPQGMPADVLARVRA